MLVRDVMQCEVVVVGPGATLALAARMMRDQDVGCVPVIENRQLIGTISDRDIVVRGVAGALDPHRAIVRDVMSGKALVCRVEDSVDQARDLMATHLIKHLPVLDRRQRVLGLVSLRARPRPAGRKPPTSTSSRGTAEPAEP